MMEWRLITQDGVSGSFGLAADESIALRAGNGESPPTLRLYTYESHSALVGRFQTIQNELNIKYCLKNGIHINRRPTGGGAIIMGAGQLGVALMLKGNKDDSYYKARNLMEKFSLGITSTLKSLGIDSSFRGKNDIEVNGRKIAGLGLHRTGSGGMLFHASILFDLDVELMLNVLKTPFKNVNDKTVSLVSGRVTTLRKLISSEISMNKFRSELSKGFSKTFDVELTESGQSDDELRAAKKLEAEKYLKSEWVYQSSKSNESDGTSKLKTSGGIIEVSVELSGRTIKKAFIGGDFYAAEHALADLEQSLYWHSVDEDKIRETLSSIYKARSNDLSMISSSDIIDAVQIAVSNAILKSSETTDPYGCFVSPGAHV